MSKHDYKHLEQGDKFNIIALHIHSSLKYSATKISTQLNDFGLSDLVGLRDALTEIIKKTKT